MAIYGTALLAGCLVLGVILGQVIGYLVGLDKNIGGVGIAMLLLIMITDYLQRHGRLESPSKQGILFWSAIYIPIVVAMAASQNVVKALSGGWLALVAGGACVLACFACVPLLGRLAEGETKTNQREVR